MPIKSLSRFFSDNLQSKRKEEHMILGVGLQDYSYSNMNVKKEDDNKKVDSVGPIFKDMRGNREAKDIKKSKTKEEEEDDSSLQIVVKPDGSRVLIITQKVGDMETSTSIKISEPTYMPNDSAYLNEDVPDIQNDTVYLSGDETIEMAVYEV